jgi:ferric-dicitrate binding protein FerR (iron transport regulator)
MAGNEDREASPRSRRRWAIVLGALAVVMAAAVVVLVVFQPQRLILDDEVDEAVPTAQVETVAPDQSTAQVTPSTAPTTLRAGSFGAADLS